HRRADRGERRALAAAAPLARGLEPAPPRHLRAPRAARHPRLGHHRRGDRDRPPLRERGLARLRERRARPHRPGARRQGEAEEPGVRMAQAEGQGRYDPQAVEAKWQRRWEEARAFAARAEPGEPAYYVLEMFPYPSGRIHMGHVRNYRWEQLFFLRMLERGLAYRRRSLVNWCAHCETVLANEQVVDGRCWRCDGPVVDRELEQWFFRITAYAEELLRDLDRLSGWPERVLTMQRNWIGRSPGAEIRFPLDGRPGDIAVFTTRADTLFGVTFMSLAAEHPLVSELVAGTPAAGEVAAFAARVRATSRAERAVGKEGVATGA